MQTAGRENVYYHHSGDNKPAITVEPGEIFHVDTELCSGTWLQKTSDIWSREKCKGPNPTVCVGVRGARPGDTLAVEIRDVQPEHLGYTCISDRRLGAAITGRDMEPCPRIVTIENGFVKWSDSLQLPLKPMIGTIGTSAPAGRLNSYGGFYGGNMDVQEVTTGTTLYLPVCYPEALLNVGDVHAIQGDGEICNSGGIECRARVTLRTYLGQDPSDQKCVRAENSEYVMTIACLENTDESFYLACGELIRFVCSRYILSAEECYSLASQLMQARCTQFVNPTRSYICKMPKAVLEAGYQHR